MGLYEASTYLYNKIVGTSFMDVFEDCECHTRQTFAFVSLLKVLPISEAIPVYADEKARLRRQGEPIDDFDLLIATTAVCHGLTLVTDNLRHMSRVSGVKLENWVER